MAVNYSAITMEKLCFLLILCLLWSCESKPTVIADEPTTYETPVVKRDTCLVAAETMEGNRYVDFTAKEQVLLRATDVADWQLEVYSLEDCSMKAAYQLPENFSPDYPYFLADINYNTSQRMVGVRGYKKIFVVDLDNQRLSKPISPAFPKDRLADAESGAIQHLEVWEDYLVGVCQDWGAFVFSMNKGNVKALKPVADYITEEGDHRSLFLIRNANGAYQAIMPALSAENGEFSVNTLFPAPLLLDPDATVHAPGSPYVRFKDQAGKLIGVNLQNRELLPVIEEVE